LLKRQFIENLDLVRPIRVLAQEKRPALTATTSISLSGHMLDLQKSLAVARF